MATTTTNYGFDIPQSTDLVKDGATAIATLGQDIDTAMNTALGTKKAMGVLLSTVSFSGVASTSFAANTFTSTYTNYKILWRITAATADANLFLRLRASGSDASAANYSYGTYGFRSNNTSFNYGAVSDTSYYMGSTEETSPDNFRFFLDIDLAEPFVADYTSIKHISAGCDGSSNYTGQSGGGFHSIKTAYDSATLAVASGNMTGFYSVYGYNK